MLRAAVSGLLPDDIRLRRQKSDPGAVIFGEVERAVVQNGFQDMGLVHAGIIDAAAVGSMYRDMIRLFAEGEPHYKFLAYRLWTIFVGECVWRTSFDQTYSPCPSNAYRRSMEASVEQQHREPESDDRLTVHGAKKPYATPVLTEYGSVAELTQSGAGTRSDGTPTNSQLRP